MSNYFELIQNISKEFYSKAPSVFSEITNKKYTNMINEIQKAATNFMLGGSHRFREKTAIFNTVVGQQKYSHVFDTIQEHGMWITDIYGKKSEIKFNSDKMKFLTQDISSGMPTEYTISNNRIYFNTLPDAVYTITVFYLTRKIAKGIYAIDSTSASGQNKLYLASTTGLSVGDSLVIEVDTDREELIIIDTIETGDYITATGNLVYSHSSGTAELYKKTFQYETDEPNFPEDYHDILEYAVLMRLYYDDRDNLVKFSNLYKEAYSNMIVESRQTEDDKPRFTT